MGSSAGIWSNFSETSSYFSGQSGLPAAPMNRSDCLSNPIISDWLSDASFIALEPNAPMIVPPTVGQLVPEKARARLGDWLV